MAGAWKTSGSINNQHGVRRTSLARCDTQSEGSETNAQLAEGRDGDSGSDGDRVRPAGCGAEIRRHPQDVRSRQPADDVDPRGGDHRVAGADDGVFNNLVMYDQHVPQNSLSSTVPDLATGWSWNE